MAAQLLLIRIDRQQRVYPDLLCRQAHVLLCLCTNTKEQKNASYHHSPDVSHVLLKSLG